MFYPNCYYTDLRALRVARSAIQMLALSISQQEQGLAQRTAGFVGSLVVPDHDWIRGRDKKLKCAAPTQTKSSDGHLQGCKA